MYIVVLDVPTLLFNINIAVFDVHTHLSIYL